MSISSDSLRIVVDGPEPLDVAPGLLLGNTPVRFTRARPRLG
ncbi:hypothetical protein U5640_22825 [Streptomyces sp. SS7]